MTAKDAFKAEAQSAGEFLTRTGEYFYIPVYQRDYSWKTSDDIKRLFSDVTEGIGELTASSASDSLIFIGALILVEDRKREQIHPIVRAQVPARVSVIIDGQQRCTTLLVWACALLDTMHSAIRELDGRKNDQGWDSAIETANSALKLLSLMVHDDERGPDPCYGHYPRMIRAHQDCWSRRATEAKYVSPIARLLRHTSEWLRNGVKVRLDYTVGAVPELDRPWHDQIAKALSFFMKRCTEYSEGESFESITPPTPMEMCSNMQFQSLLWGNEWPSEMAAQVAEPTIGTDREQRNLRGLVRLTAMANFVMSRVCFTVVRSDREAWAFDMFDALNTTGQPLTAFETFRPIVIKAAGIENYRDSQEFKRLNEVTEFLGETSDGKVSRTEKLIIHARLYQRGEKMPKRLAVQRVWMKRHYEAMTVPDRMTFLNGLANIAEFTSVFAAPHEHLQLCKDSATHLALMQLSEIKHDIVIPVLTRFLSLAKAAAAGETQAAAYEDLRTAIRATVAFATLWRIAKGGTEKIDDCFRALMRGDVLARTGAQVGPYCTQSSSTRLPPRLLSISNYISDLNAFLAEEAIASEDDWVKRAVGRAAYSEGSQITRFFLAAAMNDTISDPAAPGLLKRGRIGTSPMLQASAAWKAEGFHIEHIAPQNGPGQTWPPDIYQNEALKHSLGNLTLLPGSVNGAIKDWAWEKKRAVFGLLSTADLAEATRKRTELTELGTIPEFPTLEKVVANAHFYSYLQPVAHTQVWDAAAINARSENLSRLGHQQLTKWLKL